jgi:hypothetical protein
MIARTSARRIIVISMWVRLDMGVVQTYPCLCSQRREK